MKHLSIFSWALAFVLGYGMISIAHRIGESWDCGYYTGILMVILFSTRKYLVEHFQSK